MTRDAMVLLSAGARAWRQVARRAPLEQVVLAVVVAVACGWAVRASTHDVLASFGPQQASSSLGVVTGVSALLVTASAFSASLALRPELEPFAHRFSARGVQLSRSVVAGAIGVIATAGLVTLVGVGTPLRPADTVRLACGHLPAGVLAGLGVAAGAEAAVRALVRTRGLVLLSRLASALLGLGAAAALVSWPSRWWWAALAGAAVWSVVAMSGGLAPLRPQWLTSRQDLRRHPAITRPAATHRFWHPLCLLGRDSLALPMTTGLILLVGAAGAVGRVSSTSSLSQLYVALWGLLVIVPASAMGLVVVAKATPAGGGLFGHRLLPSQVARAAAAAAVVAACGVMVLGVVVTSVAGGAPMRAADVGRFGAVTVVACCLSLATAGVRPVRAAVVDLPAATSLAYFGAAAVLVGALDGASWRWVAIAVAFGVPTALALVTAQARRCAPFTR